MSTASSTRHYHTLHIHTLIILPPNSHCSAKMFFLCVCMSARSWEKVSTFVCPYVSGWRRARRAPCWEHRWCRGWPHSHMGPPAFWIPHLLFRPGLTTPHCPSLPPLPHTHTQGQGPGHCLFHYPRRKDRTQHMGELASTQCTHVQTDQS